MPLVSEMGGPASLDGLPRESAAILATDALRHHLDDQRAHQAIDPSP